MGRAFTAVVDDIDALYWNPAGLSTYRSSQVGLQYNPLPIEGSHQYLAYSQPLYALGNFGIGIVNLATGELDRLDENNIRIGSYDTRETGYLASYAYRFGDHYASGVTLKMAEKVISDNTERGFGADWGNLYILNDRYQFGLMLRNLIQPSYSYETEKETFPRIARAGAAARFFNGHLLTAMDLEKTLGTSQGMRWHMGVEGFVVNNIFLRLGLNQTEIATGLGIRFKNSQFDYSAGFQDIGLVNRFSLRFFFGGYEVDIRATPSVFSPVGLQKKVLFRVNTSHRDRVVKWVMTIRDARGNVVQSFQGHDAPPPILEWDGVAANGRMVEPGNYIYRMSVTTTRGTPEMTPIREIKIIAPTPIELETK